MGEWIRITGVGLLAVLSLLTGLRISRLPKKWWVAGYFIPLVCLFLIGALRRFPRLIFVAGFGWLVKGRMEFVLLGVAIPMLFAILVPHVATKRLKVLLLVLLGVSSIHFYLLPFFAPVFSRGKISKLKTTIIDDICIQSTDYTCGPASAVTALRVFGIEGKESDIGVAAYTCPTWGTCDDLLADAMEKLHGDDGIECTYRYFKTIE